MTHYRLAIHGGAGTILRSDLTPDLQALYEAGLLEALSAGEALLRQGLPALHAVEAAVASLEDNILFNAGRGAVFSANTTHEMEASIMCGKSLRAGATALVHGVRHPIHLASAIMNHTQHVFMVGEGAIQLAKDLDLDLRSEEWFYSDQRFDQLQEAIQGNRIQLDHHADKMGTVGAVAIDQQGHLAAATSTGGMTNKLPGRVGDTAIIGAGTWADDQSCAVSCTGHGEYFIRGSVARDIASLIEYADMPLQAACEKVILDKQVQLGGSGGVVAIDVEGNVSLVFNSEGMYRGEVSEGTPPEVRIF